MTGGVCSREGELLAALQHGCVGPELETHVAACPQCRELRDLAGAVLDDRAGLVLEAPVPAAGTAWWRIQLRVRREAEASARRSLLFGQALTLAATLALLVAFFGAQLVAAAPRVLAATGLGVWGAAALVGLLVLAPLAGWVAARQG